MKVSTEKTELVRALFDRIANGAMLTYECFEADDGKTMLHIGLDDDELEWDFEFLGKS